MIQSTTTSSSSSTGSSQNSASGSPSGSGSKVEAKAGASFKDTSGGSPSGSPSGSSSKVEAEAKAAFKDTSGGSPSGSPSNSPSKTSTSTGSSGNVGASGNAGASGSVGASGSASSKKGEVTVTEVETKTSQQVMTFLMNLEKKCPQKEEYKSFFEKLKGTMTTTVRVKKGFFSGMRAAVGKVADAMAFMRSRIGSRSAEVKTKMEAYQAEVVKAMEELDAIHAQIVSQNKGKRGGSLTCTAAQQAEIQVKITKWDQVTTQFVEAAIQSESSSSSSSSSSSTSANSGGIKAT